MNSDFLLVMGVRCLFFYQCGEYTGVQRATPVWGPVMKQREWASFQPSAGAHMALPPNGYGVFSEGSFCVCLPSNISHSNFSSAHLRSWAEEKIGVWGSALDSELFYLIIVKDLFKGVHRIWNVLTSNLLRAHSNVCIICWTISFTLHGTHGNYVYRRP